MNIKVAAFTVSDKSINGRVVFCFVIRESPCCHLLSIIKLMLLKHLTLRNGYTMGCPPVRGDNPRALASGLSYVQVDKHGITILYHIHQCRHCTSRDISC